MRTELDKIIEKHQAQVSQNFNYICSECKIKQSDIIKKCNDAGYSISQATLSNLKNGKGNLTLSNLSAISYALNISIFDLLDPTFKSEEKKPKAVCSELSQLSSEFFICNPDSAFMKKYIGEYNILFFKTSGSKDALIEGKLYLAKSIDCTRCEATLKFTIDEIDDTTGKAAEKTYKGELIISQAMRAVYCYLINKDVGEICMLVFQHIYTSYRFIETAMALAITTASGSNRRPTSHRMVISRAAITDDVKDYVKGQLLMNTSDIYLTKTQFKKLLSSNNLPDSFKEILQACSSKYECYCFPETSLCDDSLSELDQLKHISYIRANSNTPKYNKISRKTDEALYSLLGKKK